MDYFAGGSLFYHLRRRKRLGESLAKFYAAELALALAHLHRMNVIYRDLKLENILMDAKGHVALTDFGLSKDNVMNGEGTSTFCGTAEYIAPELLERKMYGFGVDWWSFGCLVYEMVHGQTPFYDKNRKIMFKKILYMDPIYPVGFSIYAQRYMLLLCPIDASISCFKVHNNDFILFLSSFLSGLLTREVKFRLGCQQEGGEHDIFNHSFFGEIDWDALENKEVKAPFVPLTKDGELDTTNVASYFKRLDATDSPVEDTVLGASVEAARHFPGFTYNPETVMSKVSTQAS